MVVKCPPKASGRSPIRRENISADGAVGGGVSTVLPTRWYWHCWHYKERSQEGRPQHMACTVCGLAAAC